MNNVLLSLKIVLLIVTTVVITSPSCKTNSSTKTKSTSKPKSYNVEISAKFRSMMPSKLSNPGASLDVGIRNNDNESVYVLLPLTLSDSLELPLISNSDLIEVYKYCDSGCVNIITIKEGTIGGYILLLPPHSTIKINALAFGLKHGSVTSNMRAGVISKPMIAGKDMTAFFPYSINCDTIANVTVITPFDHQIGAYQELNGTISTSYLISQTLDIPITR